jgi:chromosomal replication initiation ATPase DnaA
LVEQLSFEFPAQIENYPYSRQDFILSPENKSAFDSLHKFFGQRNSGKSFLQSLLLSGPKYCGKTHLLNIFYNQNKEVTSFIDHNNLAGVNLNNFFDKNNFYILENIETIDDQELLLHIINYTLESSSFLILSSRNEIIDLKFEINDLNSRVKNIPNAIIKPPTKDLIEILLIKNFAKKQLKLDSKIIDLIADEIINRSGINSYEAIFNIVKIIEFYCHENHQKPTLTLVNRLMKNTF